VGFYTRQQLSNANVISTISMSSELTKCHTRIRKSRHFLCAPASVWPAPRARAIRLRGCGKTLRRQLSSAWFIGSHSGAAPGCSKSCGRVVRCAGSTSKRDHTNARGLSN